MISALLIAATLSSDSIGTFFTLPTWMRQAASGGISSHDTPGSDPSSGVGGWYVPEYTNAVEFGEWELGTNRHPCIWHAVVSYGYSSVYGDYGYDPVLDMYDADGVGASYGVTNTEYSFSKFIPSESDNRTEITIGSWFFGNEIDGGGFDMFLVDTPAKRTRTIVPVPTGRYVPRSPRMTEEIQAAINSTFEAYAERQYFALQGQSNEWDTATYGPKNNRRRFWFDPMTNECEFACEPFSHSPSNRTIKTRRLVEYDNMIALGDYILNTLCYNNFVMGGSERPDWIWSSWDAYEACAWWSTTDDTIFDGTRIVPDFGWTEHPEYNDWSKCSQAFTCLWSDDVWEMCKESDHWLTMPTCRMMNRLRFDGASWGCDKVNCTVMEDKTMTNMIHAVYPHADTCAITNDTRRLFSDRISCMNQVLGLMDRTYHNPTVYYPTTGTNITYYNRLEFGGTMSDCQVEWTGSEYIVLTNSISWNSETYANRTSELSVVSGGSYHFKATETLTSAKPGSHISGLPHGSLAGALGGILSLNTSIDVGSTFYLYADSFSSNGNGASFHYYLLDHNERIVDYGYFSLLGPLDVTNVDVSVGVNYERSYAYARTIGRPGLSPTQPGFESLAGGESARRAKRARAGTVIGVHIRAGNPTVSNIDDDMSWTDGVSEALYKSNEYDYMARHVLTNYVGSLISTVYSKFVSEYGSDPNMWQTIIPIDHGDAVKCRDSTSVEQLRIKCELGPVESCSILGSKTSQYGGYEIFSSSSYLTNGVYVSGIENAGASYKLECETTCSPPQQEEREGLAMDARLGVLTRTDWQWKTLKRTDD